MLILTDNWWKELENAKLPKSITQKLRGAVGAHLEGQIPPFVSEEELVYIWDHVFRIKLNLVIFRFTTYECEGGYYRLALEEIKK